MRVERLGTLHARKIQRPRAGPNNKRIKCYGSVNCLYCRGVMNGTTDCRVCYFCDKSVCEFCKKGREDAVVSRSARAAAVAMS